MMEPDNVSKSFLNQIEYCRANDAPITARVVEAILAVLNRSTVFGRAVLDWPGKPLADALPLRCAGGFHALFLSGAEPALAPLYAGEPQALADAEALIAAALSNHEAALLPWLESPPQTNEAGRSSNYIAALAWLVSRGAPADIEMLEIGSSAGLNLLIDYYGYDLGGVGFGPEDPAIAFTPEWRGNPPPAADFRFAEIHGCDISPVEVTDPAQALRLKAYIWPEHTARFGRLEQAIAQFRKTPPDLVAADAADWVEARLALPQAPGTLRTLVHSIVWQYIPAEGQQRITAVMEQAGAQATEDRPLAWIMVEANRNNFRHELVVRQWPGGGKPAMLGTSHAHGAWIEWAPAYEQ